MAGNSSAKNKRQEEKYVQMIRELASLPTNKQCFDCNSKGPTYVDVTVGSFVCTACSGLLRGLNPPHRVKSINMSTFSQEEVELMKNRGNQLNKMVYLGLYDANAGFSPDPKDTERFKEFLSQKYEKKRWHVEPTEAMKQKARAEIEASLEKTTHAITNAKSSSTVPHSNSITNSIKSPPEPSSTVSTNIARTVRTPSVTSSQPPMLVFDAPITTPANTTSSTSILDDILQSSVSPTRNFFSDQPFGQTTTSSSNDSNWGAFVETSKHPTTMFTNTPTTNTMSMPTNNFAHPPPESADKYAALSELFSSQNTVKDHQPSIFASSVNGGHQTSTSGLTNSIFGNAPFSSNSQTHSTSSNVAQKFPVHQQAPMFSSQPFPTQFPSNSNPFQQQPFGPNTSNFFAMPPANQPNPFLNIAQQPTAQQAPNQFGKPRTNSTNPFL
ncbi:unnamed protein product [Rotaria magnacalcarata]|uniref:Arf-GAP domain-containing protein n=1 Tax=Rotaria magnacalcarata TaxID=392030 RepID=A0A816E865_9BILA|nr:unnamed protein product [Rotaria magnacalcarata]CAF1643337.1 unnamed protein product [Rotaria magnacalcarata]CAF1923070.1 unnamed protein product [Rotaria magnacalcarata]CAF1981758.1 unnamed protein product [Rotaria magnacalcarata]CAF1992035.1 unnamed protein product [Rotaria magnacalcarata]